MSRFFRWAEVKTDDDVYASKGVTRWGNPDIYPTKKEERTFGWASYFLYWVTCCMGLSTFSIGSSYVSVGLSAGETMGAVLIGAILTSANGILCGKPGSEKHLGYTVTARASFGLVGVILPLFFQIISNIIFVCIQIFAAGPYYYLDNLPCNHVSSASNPSTVAKRSP
jgi:NCS1 family nucleobase:cation symporter-1